ncbi:type III-A CRISPR-associated protein Csm2 [Thermoplasma sp. Kam2015]|uniref:type III-A CRISPR-associated protein Csm2 n=1 Tax=Thermoplasma sp. Kam2015 TaxID=2094122 RepID=UPI00137B18EC|nr:type III-A CRISPR-associated protein Csm2 [Thermoplasma sp. Kam2015]
MMGNNPRNNKQQFGGNYQGQSNVGNIIDYIKKGDTSKIVEIFGSNGDIKNLVRSPVITKTQLRKFYDPIVALRDSVVNNQKANRDEIKAKLAIMIPLLQYSLRNARDAEPFIEKLQEMIKAVIDGSDDDLVKRLDRFSDVFQAVIAYSKEKQ